MIVTITESWKGVLAFVVGCIILQHSPTLASYFVREEVQFNQITENRSDGSIENLSPGGYYISLGQSWGAWRILVDGATIASSEGLTFGKKEKLALGAGFEVSEKIKPKIVSIESRSMESWRNNTAHAPIVAKFQWGLFLQLWRSFIDLVLGPASCVLLLIVIALNMRVAPTSIEQMKGFAFIGLSGFAYTTSVSGYLDLFLDMQLTTVIQIELRCVFSLAFVRLCGSYSGQSFAAFLTHCAIFFINLCVAAADPRNVALSYKMSLILYFAYAIFAVSNLTTAARKNGELRQLFHFGIAYCILTGATTAIFLILGPSRATIISSALIAVLAFLSIDLAQKQIASLRSEFESARRLGLVASQVAHDIRSPLTMLQAAAFTLKTSDSEESALVQMAISKIQDISSDMLTQYRETKECEAIFLDEMVSDLVRDKRTEFSSRPRLEIDWDPGDPKFPVIANRTDFYRCLSNIINNSAEALAFSGTICISTEQKGDYATVCISDHGIGITKASLAYLGKSGFSAGKKTGSGLGLSFVKECVKKWGGRLEIRSDGTTGTQVTVILKRA